jgi:hypothetical protein
VSIIDLERFDVLTLEWSKVRLVVDDLAAVGVTLHDSPGNGSAGRGWDAMLLRVLVAERLMLWRSLDSVVRSRHVHNLWG